jgi:dihydroorotase
MKQILISGAKIVNEGRIFTGSVLICDDRIEEVIPAGTYDPVLENLVNVELIDGRDKYLIPGVIDDQVHFRDPGLTQKGDLFTESKAAVAGGVTSFMDMPNTNPKATTLAILEEKYKLARQKSLANYSFFLGATNDNLEEIEKADPARICGVKVFLGASTGNMLVDDPAVLEKIFKNSRMIVAIHSEDEGIIRKNLAIWKEKYGENIPIEAHPLIRSEEACYTSSKMAVDLARKHNTRLHILHLSTAKELELLDNDIPLNKKNITAEVCVHHLWFDDRDYANLGSRIKWNPAIKTEKDKKALFKGLIENKIDIIATDHAPHLEEEKAKAYLECPSGGPLIQHSLLIMLEFCHQKKISLEKVVEKMCHAPAVLYRINDRGFIRKGYYADLVLVDLNSPQTVTKDNILYKCGWSPFEGTTFSASVTHTFINGNSVYKNGKFDERSRGMRLKFNKH